MPSIECVERNFSADSRDVIRKANAICAQSSARWPEVKAFLNGGAAE